MSQHMIEVFYDPFRFSRLAVLNNTQAANYTPDPNYRLQVQNAAYLQPRVQLQNVAFQQALLGRDLLANMVARPAGGKAFKTKRPSEYKDWLTVANLPAWSTLEWWTEQ